MTSKDRKYSGMFVGKNCSKPGRPGVRVAVSLMRHIGNQAHHHLVKSGHASYVINGHSLFTFGSPSRFNCSQSAIGLPRPVTFDRRLQVPLADEVCVSWYLDAVWVVDAGSVS